MGVRAILGNIKGSYLWWMW